MSAGGAPLVKPGPAMTNVNYCNESPAVAATFVSFS